MMARRDKTQTPEQEKIGLFPNWSYAWPMNRRIIYNRASVDKQGRRGTRTSRSSSGATASGSATWWTAAATPAPNTPSSCRRTARARSSGQAAKTAAPRVLRPMESPFEKHAFSAQRSNPVAFKAIGEVLAVADERFPFIGTTYRVTEHWQTGLMTRRCSWLVEAEPAGLRGA